MPGPTILGVPRRAARIIGALTLVGAVYPFLLWGPDPVMTTDTVAYQQAAGDLFTLRLFPFRTVGYPLLLAVTGSTQELSPALLVVQLAAWLAVVWMIAALAQRLRLSEGVTIGLAVVVISPPVLARATIGLTEASCAFFVTLCVLCLVRWTERRRPVDAFVAGLAIAVAGLIRPTYQALGVIIAIAVMLWGRRTGAEQRNTRRAAALIVSSTVVLIGGMTLIYGLQFGYWGPSPIVGWNLTTKTAPFIQELSPDTPARALLIERRDASLAEEPAGGGLRFVWGNVSDVVTELAGDPEFGPSNRDYAAASRTMLAMNLRLIAANPDRYAESVAEASGRYVLPSGERLPPGRWALYAFGLVHGLVLIAFVGQALGGGAVLAARRLGATVAGPFASAPPRRMWLIAMGVIVYTAVVSVAVDVGDPRFRAPTDPLILLVTAGGSAAVWAAFRARPRGADRGGSDRA